MIYFAATSANQTDLVETEARQAGSEDVKVTSGGVYFKGDLRVGYRFCLWTRCATRVLVLFHQAEISSIDEFYDHSVELPWENFLTPDTTFAVTETVSGCNWLMNTHFVSIRLKDAIVDRMRDKFDDQRPSVDVDDPDIAFALHIDGDSVSYYIDFSGRSLAKRGYRKQQTEACLSEFLASSVVCRSQWFKDGQQCTFLDPFCGSGTLCIEAAMTASHSAPGLVDPYRFAFYKLPFHDEKVWNEVFSEADDSTVVPKCKIIGWDIDPEAIRISKANAKAAGVDGLIDFQCRDFLDTKPSDVTDSKGCIVTDPPYGIRMGDSDVQIQKLYTGIGKVITDCFRGWNASILCGDSSLLGYVDMKPDRTNSLYNGGMECQLAHYYIYTDDERNALIERAKAKREERLSAPLSDGAQMAANRLKKNLEALKPLMDKEGVSCYRLYDADMPEYSAAIDIYEGKWISLQEYAPPSTIDPDDAQRRLDELVLATERVTGIDMDCIFVKQRSIQRGNRQYSKLNASDSRFFIVREGGHRFMVNFTDYLDTGIFLDHRPVRAKIEGLAKGKRFLNLFCYTATATVYAAAGGALSTVSVDASGTYLDWAQKNMQINGFESLNHFFYLDDCMRYLDGTRDRFDLIFCDPPTFSNSKSRDSFDVQYDHSRLIKSCMAHLADDGLLIFSTNYTRFQLDEYIAEIFDVKDISQETIGDDFSRNRKIHYCLEIRKHKLAPVPVKIRLKKNVSIKLKQDKED
jgi:23S rRNA (guanine2445-N2)-methyltransferase / 23S rRNA (guanine2069-N7)-methyltransferase